MWWDRFDTTLQCLDIRSLVPQMVNQAFQTPEEKLLRAVSSVMFSPIGVRQLCPVKEFVPWENLDFWDTIEAIRPEGLPSSPPWHMSLELIPKKSKTWYILIPLRTFHSSLVRSAGSMGLKRTGVKKRPNDPRWSKDIQGTFALKPSLSGSQGVWKIAGDSSDRQSQEPNRSAKQHVKQSLAFQIPGLARLLLRSACTWAGY